MFISSPSDFIFRSLHPIIIIITIMMMKEKEKEGATGRVGLAETLTADCWVGRAQFYKHFSS